MHRLLLDLFERMRPRTAAPRIRHRATDANAAPPRPDPPAVATQPAPTVRQWYEPLDGDATALVRPYLRACEQEYTWCCGARAGVAG
ncbi:hypothetical protein [Streptomyces sp. NPDC000229]|uniref:hypothetical protein n=1 Tax=Streptomyces sp. NPDC000229 TaxID=3154247 RepID=UPI00331B7383